MKKLVLAILLSVVSTFAIAIGSGPPKSFGYISVFAPLTYIDPSTGQAVAWPTDKFSYFTASSNGIGSWCWNLSECDFQAINYAGPWGVSVSYYKPATATTSGLGLYASATVTVPAGNVDDPVQLANPSVQYFPPTGGGDQ